MKGGNVVTGDVTLQDSQIEVNLPPGTVSPARKSGESVTITGVKINVTRPGSGGAGTGAGGTPPGTGAAGTPTTPTGPAGGSGAGAGTATVGGSPPGADRVELERQVLADKVTAATYRALLTREGAVPTAEFLQRLLALRPLLSRNEKRIATLLAQMPSIPAQDPIKDVIEPLEQLLVSEDQKIEQQMDKAVQTATAKSGGTAGAAAPTAPTAQGGGGLPTTQAGTAGQTGHTTPSSTGGSLAALGKLRQLQLQPLVSTGQVTIGTLEPTAEQLKGVPQKLDLPAQWIIQVADARLTYIIPMQWTYAGPHAAEGGFQWLAQYKAHPPAGVILSTDGDRPIQFTDTGWEWTQVVGLWGTGTGPAR